jgi:hypothetical protein
MLGDAWAWKLSHPNGYPTEPRRSQAAGDGVGNGGVEAELAPAPATRRGAVVER